MFEASHRTNKYKRVVFGAIYLSALSTFFFLDYTKLLPPVGLFAFFARICGILGTILLFWDFILSLRGFWGKFIPDLEWIKDIHKKFGKWGTYLVLSHFVLISIYYAQARGINLVTLMVENERGIFRNFGFAALAFMLIIAVTSIYARKKFTFRSWLKIHMLGYIILPLGLIHNIGIGRTDVPIPATLFWVIMFMVYFVALLYAFLFSRGRFKAKYITDYVDREAVKVINIHLAPLDRKLNPLPGQYIYIQRRGSYESHPFSVSNFDPKTGMISIAPKALGKFSDLLQRINSGEIVYVDGPYGDFTQEIFTTDRAIVLLAGGIGIVPFIPLIMNMKQGLNKQVTLFYGNNSDPEIAFRDEIDSVRAVVPAEKLSVVHVVKETSTPGFETGFISLDILKKYLGEHLERYEYFVCGPPPMIAAMKKVMQTGGVPQERLHYEAFE